MIEVEVHQQLRAFLREQGDTIWPHHLTMARLVARALRLQRSALIQVGALGQYQPYRLSYLMAILLWPKPSMVVAPEETLQELVLVDLPRLQEWMQVSKPVYQGEQWPHPQFQGVFLTTPQAWFQAQLNPDNPSPPSMPKSIPTLIEKAEDLEAWLVQHHTQTFGPKQWQQLRLAVPPLTTLIRDAQVRLTYEVFQHPINLYNCVLVQSGHLTLLQILHQELLDWTALEQLPLPWQGLQQMATQTLEGRGNWLSWISLDRPQGHFSLHWTPLNPLCQRPTLWSQQPLVLIRETLDLDPAAHLYRQQLGLGELTSVQFAPDRHTAQVQLYLPDHLPLPNTPHFQTALLTELRRLLTLSATAPGLAVLLINDTPLKAQVSAALAAEFGSRVQMENTAVDTNSILISGWDFWLHHQRTLPLPQLLVIATLPFPSLEDPRVAGKVAHYKHQRQDWFRCYLLPQAVITLQRAISPIRQSQGVVALLDTRILHRSYGQQILMILSPWARLNYLDPSLFVSQNSLVFD